MHLDQEEFTIEANEAIKAMLLGSSFKAIVTGYHYDNTPFVQLAPAYGPVAKLVLFSSDQYIQ